MTRRGESKRNAVMLSTFATLSVNSAKHLEAHADRPFAAAQGDTVRQLRLMRIGRPKGRPYYGFASRGVHGGKGTFLSLHPDISLYVSFANKVLIISTF